MTKFTFNVDDASVMMSHLALEDRAAAEKIAATNEWVENEVMTAEVKINGVDVPAYVFEKLLQHWYRSMEKQIEEQTGFLKLATAVETAAEELLNERARALMEKMNDVAFDLENLSVEMEKLR